MNLSTHEEIKRGTSDFPLEFYHIDKDHPRYHMQTHWHKDIELVRVLKGSLEIQIGDTPYTLREKDGIYIPGGLAHGAEPRGCIYECIVLSPVILYTTQKIRTLIKSKILSAVPFHDVPEMNQLFDTFFKKQEGYEFEVVSFLHRIAYQAFLSQKPTVTTTEHRVDKIKPSILYIQENFASSVNLSRLAEACSMSTNYFCKVFKEATGQTPVEYITTYRIEMACEKLLSGISVTDTAYECGFNDLSYFIHVFKRHMGISPKQYAQSRQGSH